MSSPCDVITVFIETRKPTHTHTMGFVVLFEVIRRTKVEMLDKRSDLCYNKKKHASKAKARDIIRGKHKLIRPVF